jgi:hypothetical protein
MLIGSRRIGNAKRVRYVLFVLLGVVGLLAKGWLSGDLPEFVLSYTGNLAVSFSVYFIVRLATEGRFHKILSAAVAMFIVGIFEVTDGFGVMANVYDPIDLLADALGIIIAVSVDVITDRDNRTPKS